MEEKMDMTLLESDVNTLMEILTKTGRLNAVRVFRYKIPLSIAEGARLFSGTPEEIRARLMKLVSYQPQRCPHCKQVMPPVVG